MNPNAKAFTFNPTASSFTPPTFKPPAPTSPSATTQPLSPGKSESKEPIPTPPAVTTPVEVVPPRPQTGAAESKDDVVEDCGGDDEEIDENDPLFQAVIKITNGDKERAMKMLENPDELMKYPDVRVIIEAGEEDPWDVDIIIPTPEVDLGDSVVAPKVVEKVSTTVETEDQGGDEVEVVDDDPREHLNLVFIGHVDAGKSTLSGSILYVMGKVDARTIERYERDAKQRNRESWFLAFIMDTSEEERAKGKTVEVGRAHFDTEINRYTILDAPGHKNYVPNMISGAAQADVGILVISARKGEFETGFEKGGQTREHALLAKTLGVQFLVVVINKMDDPTVEWDQGRYEECVGKLKPYLNKQCGYIIKKEVKFLPIAGLTGDNILREVSEEKCPWWKPMYTAGGHNTSTPTLLSTLDALRIGGRNPDGPLRVPCLDRYFERGCVVLGKVESGTIRMDDEIVIAPTRKKVKVEGIYIDEQKVRSAKPGENVLIKFSCQVEDVQKGYVLCVPQSVCPNVTQIKVKIALVDMLEHRPLFSPGYDAVLHIHTVEIECTCRALLSVEIDGKQIRRPFARQGQRCTAILSLPMSTCIETYESVAAMGRFTLRDEGKTIAIGKVVELVSGP